MSDARTQAAYKAANELVQEIVNATGENGGERWQHLIARKLAGWADPELVRRFRDILLRVRVLLEEDLEDFEDFGPITPNRHTAAIEEIDRLLAETKPSPQ